MTGSKQLCKIMHVSGTRFCMEVNRQGSQDEWNKNILQKLCMFQRLVPGKTDMEENRFTITK